MTPIYVPEWDATFQPDRDTPTPSLDELLTLLPWEDRTEARREYFMAVGGPLSYTYGQGRGERTYTSGPYPLVLLSLLGRVNTWLFTQGYGPLNGCFANCYMGERNALGWHSDDSPEMDHTRPVVVVSFGAIRSFEWRRMRMVDGRRIWSDASTHAQPLGYGSLLFMPPRFQHEYAHQITKSGFICGPRVSFTFRAFRENKR